MSSPTLPFTPVPRASDRADGWTPEKQISFIDALSHYGSVRSAAEFVGMRPCSAYRLRVAPGAEEFAAAWDEALRIGWAQLVDIAMDRAIEGVAIPHYYKGEQVGEHRSYDNKLLMFMLRQTNPRRFGPHATDYDFVEEHRAAQKAATEKRIAMILQAEAMIEGLKEMLEHDSAHPEEATMSTEQRDVIEQRIETLTDHVETLRSTLAPNATTLLSPNLQPRQPWSHGAAYWGSG